MLIESVHFLVLETWSDVRPALVRLIPYSLSHRQASKVYTVSSIEDILPQATVLTRLTRISGCAGSGNIRATQLT